MSMLAQLPGPPASVVSMRTSAVAGTTNDQKSTSPMGVMAPAAPPPTEAGEAVSASSLGSVSPPASSVVQAAEQPSPSATLPSSHCSPVSTVPLPQTATSTVMARP